jgi:HPt (histidine-containing phosphotransfer) domain-containing protein
MKMEVPNDIMGRYLDNRRRDLAECLHSLADNQFFEIEKIGHQIKGNGSTFGYPELSLIGANLELAAQTHDLETLNQSLKEFSHWLTIQH